jgi:hypothetical protein
VALSRFIDTPLEDFLIVFSYLNDMLLVLHDQPLMGCC